MRTFRLWVWLWFAWMAGGLVGFFCAPGYGLIVWFVGLFGVLFVVVRPAHSRVPVLLILSATIVVSCAYTSWRAGCNQSQFPVSMAVGQHPFSGEVSSEPVRDGDLVSFVLEEARGEQVQVMVKLSQPEQIQTFAVLKRRSTVTGEGQWTVPEESGNVGVFNFRTYLREQHLFWVIHVKAEQVEIGKRHRFSVLGMGDGIRQRLVRRFSERYSVRAAGLLSGMLLGDRRAILPADAATLSAIGLGHLLAISGLHVTVLVASWLWLMRKFKMLRVVRYGLTYGLLALFVVVTGASIPVVRAAISGAIGLFFAYQRRWRDAQSIIAATGLVMLLWDPYILLSVSYQLSFAVTFGIVTACPVMVGWLPKRWPVWVRAAVAVSLVAQLFSLPFQLRVFNELSLFAIPVNLVFVPFITYVITPLGYFSLGLPLASITEPLLLGFVDFCAGLNAWLVARTIWASPSWWWIAGYFGVLVMLFYDFPKTFVRRLGVAAFVGMLVVANFPPMSEGQVYVEVLDVGQGDAILLHLPNHRYWLMDGGGAIDFANNTGTWKQKLKPFDPGADVLVPLLKQRGVRELDAVVMSHANEDHVLGLQALVARIPVRHVLFNGTINGSVKIRGLYEQLLKRHIPMLRVQAGDVFPIGNGGRIVVLNPPRENGVPFFTPDQNKMSVVLLLQLYGQSLLLTGDLDSHADAQVVQEAKALGVLKAPLSVLKVSHHGSKYASSVPFLAMWRPRVAVISVGKWNRYGHPHRDTLARLARIGANVLRTDQAGAVHVTIRPSGIHVYTKKVWQNLP